LSSFTFGFLCIFTTVELWDADGWAHRWRSAEFADFLRALDVDRLRGSLRMTTAQGIYALDGRTGAIRDGWEVSRETFEGLAGFVASADGRTVVGWRDEAGVRGLVHVFDAHTGEEHLRFECDPPTVNEGAVSPDGRWLALVGNSIHV